MPVFAAVDTDDLGVNVVAAAKDPVRVQTVRVAEQVMADNEICQVQGSAGGRAEASIQSFITAIRPILAIIDTSLNEAGSAAAV